MSQRRPPASIVPLIGTPARLRVQPQPLPLGQIASTGAHSPSLRLARSPRASISRRAPSIVTSRLPGRRLVWARRRRSRRSHRTQNDWVSGPTWARAAQSITSGPKTPM